MSCCYCSIIIIHDYFVNDTLSDIFPNEHEMIKFIVDYLEGPEGSFFFDIKFESIPQTVEELRLALKTLIIDKGIIVKLKVQYINQQP